MLLEHRELVLEKEAYRGPRSLSEHRGARLKSERVRKPALRGD